MDSTKENGRKMVKQLNDEEKISYIIIGICIGVMLGFVIGLTISDLVAQTSYI